MKTEIGITGAAGKTLEGFAFSFTNRQAVLTFTDGTFTALGIELGHERGDDEIRPDTLELLDFGHSELVRLGIATEAELAQASADRSRRFTEDAERRDRAAFERLQQKYGSPLTTSGQTP